MNHKGFYSDSVIPKINSQKLNSLSIQISPPTPPATPEANKKLEGLDSHEEEEEEEHHIIPLIEEHNILYNKQSIIKEGLVLCTRTEEWYTKKKTTMREVQLRKTRLRWRQFKAILRTDRIELYHVTNLLITATSRLAHVIYLNNQYPYRRVKLSLISAQDCIWCLEFLHYETKSLISFHFQSSSLIEAQRWYMAIYRILPPIAACKKPIPPFFDIFVMATETKTEAKQRQKSFMIRVPLKTILINDDTETQWNIRAADLKPVIWTLLKKNGGLPQSTRITDLKLCWKSVTDVIDQDGEGAPSTAKAIAMSSAAPIDGNQIEWITEDTQLIGPQLIEQKHRLELRVNNNATSTQKDAQNNTKAAGSVTFDGILIQRSRNSRTKPHQKYKKTPYYTILYGHHLFFLDKAYYHYYKRIKDQKRQVSILSNTKKSHSRWFSATTGGIHMDQRKDKWTSLKDNKVQWQHINHSTPHITPSSTTVCDQTPDPMTLINARFVIDLNQVAKIQPLEQEGNCFEMYMKGEDGKMLQFEATSTQTMLQWITLITNKLKIDHHHYLGSGCSNGFETYQSRPENVRNILQSGLLYVKKDFKKHFEQQYCILTKSFENNRGGLMMFDVIKSKKQWWRQLDFVNDNMEQREPLPVYEKRRQLTHLDTSYIYSGDECILDKLLVNSNNKQEPYRLYKDGAVSGGNKTSECVFVIWQIAKRHIVPNLREYMSLFKMGHRLGNRGSCWVFKARNRQERDEWVWALHKEFLVMKL